jgi:8-oxo-dGTP diphosphatase
MSDKTLYVCGAMFNEELTKLALIRKNRPEWQAGKLNFIGGHVEPGEMFITAMVREFWEETGVKTKKGQWRLFDIVEGPTSYVKMYTTIGDLTQLKTTTDELIFAVDLDDLPDLTAVPNLHWLIPAALKNLRNR